MECKKCQASLNDENRCCEGGNCCKNCCKCDGPDKCCEGCGDDK